MKNNLLTEAKLQKELSPMPSVGQGTYTCVCESCILSRGM